MAEVQLLSFEGTATAAGGQIGDAISAEDIAKFEYVKVVAINQTDGDAMVSVKERPDEGDDRWLTSDLLVPANSMIEGAAVNIPATPGSIIFAEASADDAVYVAVIVSADIYALGLLLGGESLTLDGELLAIPI